MLYYLWAFTGQRAARYWKYLISGSGASNGSLDFKQKSNSPLLVLLLQCLPLRLLSGGGQALEEKD